MNLILLALATLYATVCAVFDARTYRVPNTLTLPALGAALVYRVLMFMAKGEPLVLALGGALFLYAAWFNGFFRGADAKVMMALWLLFPDVTLCVTVCAAIVVYWLIRRAFSKATSKLPALVPTALGVWMYTLYLATQLSGGF
jgi:Flp pilus assembly protein protease CpaA